MNQTCTTNYACPTSPPCDCCEGPRVLTPLPIYNRPGLDQLSYRVGTYGTFFATMQARLSSTDYPELAALRTREKSDASIALLDAWSIVADVLTFYQERIANEGYLRTATERRSVLELARLIGYALRPGVASSVYLAYSLARDAEPVTIPPGTRANSIPGPGEQMQAFETSDPLDARVEWNLLKPRLARPQLFLDQDMASLNEIFFAGISTGLKPNDRLLLVSDSAGANVVPFRVLAVEPISAADPINGTDRTRVSVALLEPPQLPAAVIVAAPAAAPMMPQRLESMKSIATRYSNLEQFKVAPDSEMARYVQGLLSEVIARVDAGTPVQELLAEMNDKVLPRLREQQSIAKEGSYRRLEPWVSGLLGELEANVADIAQAQAQIQMQPKRMAAAPPAAGAMPAAAQAKTTISPGTRLRAMLGDLGKPVSIPPANALRLARNVAASFAASSDTLPRLIARLEPSLAPVLYAAWKNSVVTPADPGTVYALRIKAAPFGHSAPLKPVLDEQGRVVGQEEWPLDGTASTSVEFDMSSNQLRVSGRRGGERYSWSLNVGEKALSETRQWGQFTSVTVTTAFSAPPAVLTTISVSFGSLATHNTEIDLGTGPVILIAAGQNSIGVTVGSNQFDVLPDQLIQESAGTDRLAIDWATNSQLESDVLAVDVATLLPPPLNVLPLDTAYEQIIPGTWVLIERADQGTLLVTRVIQVQTVAKAEYGLTGKSTVLTLQDDWLGATDVLLSVFRATAVHVLSEELTLADKPLTDPVCDAEIELDALYDGLEAGRWAIVAGERSDVSDASGESVPGVQAAERVMLAAVRQDVKQVTDPQRQISFPWPGDSTHTFIQLSTPLAYCYKRDTVRIYGNVVKATHGETRQETLGAGNASQALQQFTLKQSPLTYVSAPTVAGVASTLQVRVNDVQWHEVDSLAGLDASARNFITRTDDDAKTSVIFGNGVHGARLPTGLENVKATYRNGIGKPGNVKAGQISLLNSRPLGVSDVINPIRASGGADAEGRDQARRNAPLAVMALDRLVSTQDYADFSRTFGGVGKAAAARLSNGRQQRVHVTIAGVDDIPIDETSDLYHNLFDALHLYGDPYLPITLAVRERLALVISANIRVDPDYQWETLEPKVRSAVLAAFSFDNVDLGQDLLLADAIKVMQGVPGVTYVDVDVFDTISEAQLLAGLDASAASSLKLRDRIAIQLGRFEQGQLLPAQLSYLAPDVSDTLILQEIKS
jgi:predicted phage baseplate assembly protein